VCKVGKEIGGEVVVVVVNEAILASGCVVSW
jgi:hypothetical protein